MSLEDYLRLERRPVGGGAGISSGGPAGPDGRGPGGATPTVTGGEIGVELSIQSPTKPKDLVNAQIGESIRHRMSNQSVIDRALMKDPKIAEVSLDPTDARRVVIKAVSAGGTTLELTDATGAKEKVLIRVR